MQFYILLIATVGGVATMLLAVVFLFRQKTVVDQEGHVTEVEIPLFGKIKSNYPSVGLAIIGAGLCAFAINTTAPDPVVRVTLNAQVRDEIGTHDLPVQVGVVPQEYFRSGNLGENGQSSFSFGVDAGKDYQVVVLRPAEFAGNSVRYRSVQGPAQFDADKARFIYEGDLK